MSTKLLRYTASVRNFGLFTTLVDHLLGTFHYEAREEPFSSEELGIGTEPNYPIDYLSQLAQPFRRREGEASVSSAV